jgi:hypothetical protein
MVYRLARSICTAALLALVASRLLFGGFLAWRLGAAELGTALLVLCVGRFCFVVADVATQAIGWQRAILPLLLLLTTGALLGGPGSALFAKIFAAAAEVAGLVLLYVASTTAIGRDNQLFEDRLFEKAQRFIPPMPARIMVAEITTLRAAVLGLVGRAEKADGFGYVENSLFRVLPLIILFCSPADILLVHVLLGLHGLLWTAILIGLDVYALAWAYGTLRATRARPHRIAGRFLFVHKGIYARAAIELNSIRSAVPHKRSKRVKEAGAADLSIRGTEQVEILLDKPAHLIKWFAADPKPVLSIVISADDPSGLCRAIERAVRADAPLPA